MGLATLLINHIVGTFIGAFNEYEIRQLKAKFQDLSAGHNILVHVTKTHSLQITDIHKTMKQIVELYHLMAEYNPGTLMMQIYDQIQKFEDK